jgi:hypothetical protein
MHSNAVAQFEAWSREESAFRTATAKADRERQQLEGVLAQLRQEQKKLSHETRESSDLLGRFHRECGLLHQEKERLLRQLKEERAMLEQCARDTEEILLQETTAKKLFCKEVEALNSELAESLSNQEDRAFQKMMCIETVTTLQEYLLKLEEEPKNHNEPIRVLTESLQNWMDAATASENPNQELSLLKNDVEMLRSHASGIVANENKGVRQRLKLVCKHGQHSHCLYFFSICLQVPTGEVLEDMERSWEVGEKKGDIENVSFCYGETDTSQDDSMVD